MPGLGKIQRRIKRAFVAHPGALLTTGDFRALVLSATEKGGRYEQLTVAADTTVTATAPPHGAPCDFTHYRRDCGAGGADCRIARGRRIVAAAAR